MTLCRLLRRCSLRRYTTNPYPFPFPTSAAQNHGHPPSDASNYQYQVTNSTTAPVNHHYPSAAVDSRYPGATAPPVDHRYPGATAPPVDPRYPGASAQSVDPRYPNTAAPNHFYSGASNHQYNPQFPPATAEPSNYYQNPNFSAAATTNQFQYPNSSAAGTNSQFPNSSSTSQFQHPTSSATTTNFQFPNSSPTAASASSPYTPQRSYGFSSAEEAAADRRRRKRRLRIEPPLYALRPNPQTPPPNANNPDRPRLPDSTSALVGPRLNLHNRVQSLIRAGDLDAASYVARQSVFQYVRPTVFTCNAIIAAMYRGKRYNDAKALFQYFFRQFEIIPNIVSYNNLIVSHCESNEIEEARKVYDYILENAPFSPSAVTYRHLTKGLIDAGRINEAVDLLREMLHKGHGADSLVYNNVILGFLNLGNLDKANELFDELKERCTVYDGVVNATFMDWFFNQGKPKEAMASYRDLMSRNYRMVPATRNVLLETLLRHGKTKEAWDLFQDMLDDHTPPTFQAVNSDTINMMVNECFKEGKVEEAMDVFTRSGKGEKSKPFQMDVAGFNNMMVRLSELDMMDEAEQYYQQLCNKSLSPDVNTYRTLIDAYVRLDRVDNMLDKYSKMVSLGLRVIPPYANKWFGYLIDKARASDCVPILSKMIEKETKPDVTTCDVVIRGLVNEGNFDATANLLREMTNHAIGTTASLKEFVLDSFERIGRRAEIENILDRFSSSYLPQRRPNLGPQSPPRVANPTMPPQMSSYGNHQHTEQLVHQTEQSVYQNVVGEQDADLPRAVGQSGY